MIKLRQSSLKKLMANMTAVRKTARSVAIRAANKGAESLHASVRQNISLTDHSPRDLVKLDHPYAARHAQIVPIHTGGKIQNPSFLVHTQTGRMLNSLKQFNDETYTKGGRSVVFFDQNVKHVKYVIEGTSMMHGRDVLGSSAIHPDVQKEIASAVEKEVTRLVGEK